MIEQSGHETRDVTVGSSVQRHQLKQYLRAIGVTNVQEIERGLLGRTVTFVIPATPAQWEGINQWLQRTKVD